MALIRDVSKKKELSRVEGYKKKFGVTMKVGFRHMNYETAPSGKLFCPKF